jgi:hypothetical protein
MSPNCLQTFTDPNRDRDGVWGSNAPRIQCHWTFSYCSSTYSASFDSHTTRLPPRSHEPAVHPKYPLSILTFSIRK